MSGSVAALDDGEPWRACELAYLAGMDAGRAAARSDAHATASNYGRLGGAPRRVVPEDLEQQWRYFVVDDPDPDPVGRIANAVGITRRHVIRLCRQHRLTLPTRSTRRISGHKAR